MRKTLLIVRFEVDFPNATYLKPQMRFRYKLNTLDVWRECIDKRHFIGVVASSTAQLFHIAMTLQGQLKRLIDNGSLE